MAEQAIGRRKSHLFLNNISAVTNTYDELVRDKLEGGKFPTTITGIIQLIGVILIVMKKNSKPSRCKSLFSKPTLEEGIKERLMSLEMNAALKELLI